MPARDRDSVSSPADQARVYLDHNRPAQALEIVSAHLATNPDDVDALLVAVLVLIATQAGPAAAGVAEHAVQVAPGNPDAWNLLAASYIATSNGPGAQRAAATAVSLAPESWSAHAQIVYADVAAKQVTLTTLEHARIAIELDPQEPLAHFAKAEALTALKKRRQARVAYRDALALDPQDSDIRNNLHVAEGRRNIGASAAGFLDILAQGPGYELALYNLKATATQAMRSVHLIIWAIWFVAAQSTLQSRLAEFAASTAGQLTRAGLALLCCIVVAAYVLRLRAGAGIRFRRFVGIVVSFDRAVPIWLGLLAFTVTLMIFAGLAPCTWARVAYGFAFVALVIGMLLSRRIKKRLAETEPSAIF